MLLVSAIQLLNGRRARESGSTLAPDRYRSLSGTVTESGGTVSYRVSRLPFGAGTLSILLCVGTVLMYLETDRAVTILLAGGCGLLALLPVIRLAMMAGHFTGLAQPRFVWATLLVASGLVGIVG